MTGNIVNHRINLIPDLQKIIDLRQVLMVKVFQNVHFDSRIDDVPAVILHLLYHNLFLQILMIRQINLPDSTMTEGFYYAIGVWKYVIIHSVYLPDIQTAWKGTLPFQAILFTTNVSCLLLSAYMG